MFWGDNRSEGLWSQWDETARAGGSRISARNASESRTLLRSSDPREQQDLLPSSLWGLQWEMLASLKTDCWETWLLRYENSLTEVHSLQSSGRQPVDFMELQTVNLTKIYILTFCIHKTSHVKNFVFNYFLMVWSAYHGRICCTSLNLCLSGFNKRKDKIFGIIVLHNERLV